MIDNRLVMKLYIRSESKDNKYIKIDNEEFKAEGDLHEFIKKLLVDKKLKLSDFEDFIAKPSESFTGYREAVVIVNTLKYLLKAVDIKDLEYPKYHKDPNINIK